MLKLKEKIERCNLNYKKEIRNWILINIIAILPLLFLVILKKNYTILIYYLLFLLLINVFYYTRYDRKISKNKTNLINDFINVFSYFRIYISNNRNVYMSIKEISNYGTPFIKNKLLELLDNIDEDKSIKPFLTFSSYFESKKVEEVMIAIYEMIDEGNNENYISQFVSSFESFKRRIETTVEEKRMNRFNTICSLSVIGVGILMVVIMLGIVNMIGDLA